MGIFDLFKKVDKPDQPQGNPFVNPKYADASSIAEDERPYYQPDDYYTFVTHPGTQFETKILTFEERKKKSYPSQNGLFVPEILLLEYCSYGTYPKPSNGYPGFWWFKYGIRDIGKALSSLEERGFIEWASKEQLIEQLKVEDLKTILKQFSLPISGSKAVLISRIKENIPVEQWPDAIFEKKYQLTAIGTKELKDNLYVPYMHKHKHATTEDGTFGDTFTVWDMNKLIAKNNRQSEWKKIIGEIEKKKFGVDMASFVDDTEGPVTKRPAKVEPAIDESQRIEFQQYLKKNKSAIKAAARSSGDGFAEESKGLDLMQIGKDKEALFQFFVSIEKKFDAPALYRETAKLLHKYGLFEEEQAVLEAGIKIIPAGNRHRAELEKRINTIQATLNKE